MRQRVVHLARQPQALARDGGVARVLGQALDARGALGHARVELGVQRGQRRLFLLQPRHQLRQRGADGADLVAAGRHVEAGARAACQLARLQRQAVQPAQQPQRHRHCRQRRQQADRQHAQQHHAPGMARAGHGAPGVLAHHHLPAGAGGQRAGGAALRWSADQVTPAVGQVGARGQVARTGRAGQHLAGGAEQQQLHRHAAGHGAQARVQLRLQPEPGQQSQQRAGGRVAFGGQRHRQHQGVGHAGVLAAVQGHHRRARRLRQPGLAGQRGGGIAAVGGGLQAALGVQHADPAELRLLPLQGEQPFGRHHAGGARAPLRGRGLHGGQRHLQLGHQRVGGLAGGLAELRLGVGDHVALGLAGGQLGGQQRAGHHQREHRPAQRGGEVAPRIEALPGPLAGRCTLRRVRLR